MQLTHSCAVRLEIEMKTKKVIDENLSMVVVLFDKKMVFSSKYAFFWKMVGINVNHKVGKKIYFLS